MSTTPINALPSPDGESPNLPPLHFDALNAVLDSRLLPRFTNTAARGAAITAPTAMQVAATTSDKRLWWYDGITWQYLGGAPPAMIAFPGASGWNVAGVGTYSLPRYYKDGSGLVRGQGVLSHTAASEVNPTMGTLPTGYRPLNFVESVVLGVTGAGSLATYQAEIATTGAVRVIGTVGTGVNFFLNTLIFNPNN